MYNHKECFIGERLRQRREQLGMSQKALAKAVRIGTQQLQILEKDKKRGTNIRNLLLLCNALACSADWLLGRTDTSPEGLDAFLEARDAQPVEHEYFTAPW